MTAPARRLRLISKSQSIEVCKERVRFHKDSLVSRLWQADLMKGNDERQGQPKQDADFCAKWNHVGDAENEMRDEANTEAAGQRAVCARRRTAVDLNQQNGGHHPQRQIRNQAG